MGTVSPRDFGSSLPKARRGRRAAGATAPSRAATLGYFWSLFALGLVVASIGPALPGLAAGTGVTLAAVSVVFAAYRGGFMLGSLTGGSLLDRLPGNMLVAIALLCMAAGLASIPVLPALAVLAAVFLVVGTAGGMVEVGGNTLLLWSYGSRVGPYMGALHFAFGVGAMLAPAFIGQAVSLTGALTGAFVASALLIVPGAVVLFRAPTPRPPGQDRNATAAGGITATVLIAVFLMLYVGAESGFGGWIYTYAVRMHRIEPAQAALLTSLFWGALTAGRLASIPLAARLQPRTLLLGAILGCLVCLGLLTSADVSTGAAFVWIATAGTGLSMAAIFPSTMSFAGTHLRVTGSRSRWFFVGAGAGGMSVPWALGHILEAFGARAVMLGILLVVAAMVMTFAALLTVVLRSGRRESGGRLNGSSAGAAV